jgi:hypothetical protein
VSAALSEPLQRLLLERLPSLEQIAIVLLLREDRTRAWSAPEVSSSLGTPPESTAMRLFLLASNGIVIFEGGGIPRYRFSADPTLEPLFAELAGAYAERREVLVSLVGGGPADPLRSFADAFKLKKS